MRLRPRSGVALLEAIVALTVMTIGMLATVGMVRQAIDSADHAERAEAEVRRASAFMDAIALWPRADLDRHLGVRAEGPWRLDINRPAPTLYLVTLSDSASDHQLLRTALYRPESPSAP
jgi:hypothetical protein